MCTVLVLISQIKEIRVGRNTDVLRNKELEGSWQDACIFSIIFGDSFDSLDLIANSADEANIWVTGLTYLTTGRHKSGVLVVNVMFTSWFSGYKLVLIKKLHCVEPG